METGKELSQSTEFPQGVVINNPVTGLPDVGAMPGVVSTPESAGVTPGVVTTPESAGATPGVVSTPQSVSAVNPATGLPQGIPGPALGVSTDPATGLTTDSEGVPFTPVSGGVPLTGVPLTPTAPINLPIGSVLSSTQFRTYPMGLKPTNPVIDPHKSHTYAIALLSPEVLTLAAPVAGADDEVRILIFDSTGIEHTLEVANLQNGTSNGGEIEFPALAGASVELMAFQGAWVVISAVGVGIS